MHPDLLRRYCEHRSLSEDEALAEVHDALAEVARVLGGKLAFGAWAPDDIAGEVWAEGLEVLSVPDRYDPTRPIGNFLYVHCKRRIHNLKRKHHYRAARPCKCCSPDSPPVEPCERFVVWKRLNESRYNLSRPVEEIAEPLAPGTSVLDEVIAREMVEVLARDLPEPFKGDFRRALAGERFQGDRLHALQDEVAHLLGVQYDGPDYEVWVLSHGGRTLHSWEWAEVTGLTSQTIRRRYDLGWSDSDILMKPS